MIGLFGWCIMNGDIDKYTRPMSSFDKESTGPASAGINNSTVVYCGWEKGKAPEFPKLYFTDFTGQPEDIMNSGICIKECPTLEMEGKDIPAD